MTQQDRGQAPEERDDRREGPPPAQPETGEHPASGVEHKPEPDAENIIPVKHEPGTL